MVFKNISHNRVLNIMGRLVDPQASVFITKDLVVKYLPLVERYYAESVGVILDESGKKVPLSDLLAVTEELDGEPSGDAGEKGVGDKEANETGASDSENGDNKNVAQQSESASKQVQRGSKETEMVAKSKKSRSARARRKKDEDEE